MEDIDDDFGDLYADVELPASIAINDVSNFSRLYIEQDDNNTKCIGSGPKNVDVLIQEKEAKRDSSVEADGEREVDVDDGSDSEDDLNILLNEDDNGGSVYPVARGVNLKSGGFDEDEEGGGFEVLAEGDGLSKNRKCSDQSLSGDGLELSPNGRGGGERGNGAKGSYQSQYLQYKYIRPHAASFPSNLKANGSAGVASYSSTPVRGDWDDNKCNQRMASSSLVAQSGHNFSLPRYRTIVDVNIDTFEQKPWRHPGTDITDFFNFGFDEESWKCYCNRLEQLRQQTSLPTRTLVYDFSKPKEAYEAGAEYETGAHEAVLRRRGTVSPASKIACREMKQLEVPKGRVIQVEDSILERQPSMDVVRRVVDRDPDVVIQIAVQDSMEDSSGSGKEELTHKDGSAHETSENGDCGMDDDRVIHHLGSGGGDELSSAFLEGNVKRSDRPFPKRCSQPTTPSIPVSVDSDNHGSGQISDVDGHCHQKINGSSYEGNAEAMENSNNTKEKVCRDTCNTALYMGETESLLGERTQHDHSSSYSGSHCETSGDGASTDPERFQNHLGRLSPNSVPELQKSVTCDYYNSNDSKSHHGRTKSRDSKYYARNRSPFPQNLRHYNRRLNSVSELKNHHDYEYASPLSNNDRIYDGKYTAVGHSRQDKRHHDFDSYDREDFSYYKESKFSFNYYGEKFSYNQVHAAYSKKPHRNRQSLGDETGRYCHRRWDEGEYFLEERVSRADDELMGRDWQHYERGATLNPLICKESRRFSNYSPYLDEERVTRWRRRADDFQFRKRIEKDDFLFDHKYQDDFMQEKYGYYDKERKYLDGKYERHLPSTRRGEKASGRSERKYDSPSIDLDNLWAMSNEDEYWKCTDHPSLSSRSYREPHSANRGMRLDTISPKNAYDLRLTERHGRHMRQISKERGRGSDLFGSNHDAGNTEGSVNYPDGQVHFERRHWQSESLHWTEDEYISRHEDDEFLVEEASFSLGKTSRDRRFYAKRKLIDDGEVEQCRIKLMKEGNSSNRIERSSSIISRGNHEKTVLRCRDLDDMQLVVRERKSSGRCSNAGSIMCNDAHENMDRNIDMEWIISADYNESHAEKAGQAENTEVEINQNDDKWFDKFPVTQHNEALDIEEGQIITEVNGNPVDENFGAEDVAAISDAKKKSLHHENAAKGNKVGEGYDSHSPRILEVIAKMEKRRERFKEPITLKKETDRIPNPQVDPVVETTETKQQRPARKRRWGGS